MNWWEWVFSGIGASIVILLVQHWFKSSDRTANLTAQGAKVSGSPVASGSGITQTVNETHHHHYAQAASPPQPQPTQQPSPAPAPNLQIVGANHILIHVTEDDIFQQSSNDEGPLAAVVHVTNDAQPGKTNVGAVVRATLIYRNDGGNQVVRVTGAWLGESTDSVDFHVDDAHTIVVAVRNEWQCSVPGKRWGTYDVGGGAGYLTDAHEIALDHVTVTLRLTNADTGAFYCERQFQVQINPTLNIQMLP